MKRKEVVLLILAIVVLLFSLLTLALDVYFHFEKQGAKRITGSASSSVGVIRFVVLCNNQTLPLANGWNFVSFYEQLDNYSIEEVLKPIEGHYQYIQEWDTATQEFKIWTRQGIKQFDYFNQNKSYFIFDDTNQDFGLCGRLFENWTINLSRGWESPDYVYSFPSNVSGNTFYNLTFAYMQKWNVSAQDFIIYSVLSLEPEFTAVYGGEGYFIESEGGDLKYVII